MAICIIFLLIVVSLIVFNRFFFPTSTDIVKVSVFFMPKWPASRLPQMEMIPHTIDPASMITNRILKIFEKSLWFLVKK